MMRLTTVILIASLMQVSASTLAQKITLSKTNAPLKTVLQELRQQSGYLFLYSDNVLKLGKPVDIEVNQEDFNDVLEKVFANQPLTYNINKKTIVIKEKEPSFLEGLVGSVNADRRADIDIKGKVVNENNETLPGALIKVKGTNRAVIADAKGNFELYKVDDKAILVVSYIGYETQELKVASSMGYITLKPTTNALDQVVVQGYGTTTDRLRTGNIATVTKEIIEKQPVTNVLQALQGRVPGLIITQRSGYDSAPFKVELRGRTAINPNMVVEPLYIIDGVPFDMVNLSGGSYEGGSAGLTQNGMNGPAGGESPLFNVNPSDIESISVLKDADALAIYGSKGANGVILINTKKGKAGKTKFDAEVSNGVSMVLQRYKMLNTQQYVAMRKEAFRNSGITPNTGNAYDIMVWDTTRYTDLQDLYWGDPARRLDAQFGLSGGEKNTTFRMGGSLLRATEVNTYAGGTKRMGLQLNLNHRNLDQRLNISFNSFYSHAAADIITLGGGVTSPPNIPEIFNDSGQLNYAGYAPATYMFQFGVLLKPYTSKSNFLNANLKVQYQLTKGLNASANLGYSAINNTQMMLEPIVSQNPQFDPRGQASFGSNNRVTLNLEPQIDYKLSIGNGEFSTVAGATFQMLHVDGNYIIGSGYINDNLLKSISNAPTVSATDKWAQYRYSGIFARINYNYQNKYIVNLSARRDGSTRFGPGNQYGNFGSLGLAWIFTEEGWIKRNLELLSFGKLRSSYGLTGSDNIGEYQFLSSWGTNVRSYQKPDPAYLVGRHFNPDLQWQTDHKLDIGLNLGFFKDKVSFDISFYRNRVGNQLLPYRLPSLTGFDGVLTNIPATVENRGQEYTVSARMVNTDNWSLSAHFNIGYNRNKLIAFQGLKESPYASIYEIGKPLSIRYLLQYTGLNKQTGQYTFKDFNGDGVINSFSSDPNNDLKVVKELAEKYDGGFGAILRYKGLQLDLSFHFRRGNIRESWGSVGPPGAAKNIPLEFLDRWQKLGDDARYARYTILPTVNDILYFNNSDESFTDMYFIRLNNAMLSYKVGGDLLKKIGVKSGQLYVRGQNLITITNFEGIDPEAPIFGAKPTVFTLIGGLQLNF